MEQNKQTKIICACTTLISSFYTLLLSSCIPALLNKSQKIEFWQKMELSEFHREPLWKHATHCGSGSYRQWRVCSSFPGYSEGVCVFMFSLFNKYTLFDLRILNNMPLNSAAKLKLHCSQWAVGHANAELLPQ